MERLYIPAAFLLDLIFGDPRGYPHPVILIGHLVGYLESVLRPRAGCGWAGRAVGLFLLVVVSGLTWAASWGVIRLTGLIHPFFGHLTAVFLLYTALAIKSLRQAGEDVYHPLVCGDLEMARRMLARIVSRDTDHLPQSRVITSTVESVAENTADGVTAPLFFALIGGVPLALAFKAVSTLDSMVGYRTPEYSDFGWASARFDDLLNFIPARLTALLVVIAAIPTGSLLRVVRTVWNCRHNHESPNSAYPEAAFAGWLGIRLAGPNYYNGVLKEAPYIGEPVNEADVRDIERATVLLYTVASGAVLLFTGIEGLIIR